MEKPVKVEQTAKVETGLDIALKDSFGDVIAWFYDYGEAQEVARVLNGGYKYGNK